MGNLKVALGWRQVTFTVEGNEISVELRPLKTEHMMSILPVQEEKGVGDNERGVRVMGMVGGFIDNYARNLQGIMIDSDEGERSPTVKELFDEARLIHIAGEVVRKLMEISTFNKTDAGN